VTIDTSGSRVAYLSFVSFNVAAASYDRFMGRYSVPLAPLFADFAGVGAGERVVDVGCGPGALTTELVRRLGPEAVCAVDPSEMFVEAARERHPTVAVQRAAAEQLPFADREFDAALAQLVVHFMSDPVAGLREMGRVTGSRGVVAACVWDHEGGKGPLSAFWQAARDLDPDARTESGLAGAREGHLAQLFHDAGLREIEESTLSVSVQHETFEEWWEPYTLGVGPAGAFAASLDAAGQEELRERCRALLPAAPFALSPMVWAVRGRA
jgi:SAM-dependent methyltransferase